MFNTMNDTGLTPQLRTAIRESPLTGYRLARLAGVSESSICRFLHGKGGLSLKVIDRIWRVLDLHIADGEE
jgi:plasmid maintenance system antidote protein VapI